jgi:hypothetical protein
MRITAIALTGWLFGCVFGAVAMSLVVGNRMGNQPDNTVTINGVEIGLEDATKIGQQIRRELAAEIRRNGERKMREADAYEKKGQWGGCSSYIEASALLSQAADWGNSASRQLSETAWDSGRRACDRWYSYEGR